MRWRSPSSSSATRMRGVPEPLFRAAPGEGLALNTNIGTAPHSRPLALASPLRTRSGFRETKNPTWIDTHKWADTRTVGTCDTASATGRSQAKCLRLLALRPRITPGVLLSAAPPSQDLGEAARKLLT